MDGEQSGQYLSASNNRATIGVRDGTTPSCLICPVVVVTNGSTSIMREYYRIGAVLHGESDSTMTSRYLGSSLPLAMGQTYTLQCNRFDPDYPGVQQYVSIVYVRYTEQETKPEKPPVLVNDGTVVDQSSLIFYIYEYDEAASEKRLVTDPAELARYDVRFDVSQKCVGYYADSHDPTANQSNASHHANYTPDNGEANVYEHDVRATVTELTNGSNATLVGPMAADIGGSYDGAPKEYSTASTDPPGTVHIDHVDDVYGSAIYGVKTNSIDRIKVRMNATLPENYRLEKMEVQRGDSSSAVNRTDYEYTTSGGEDVTVIYVFSRPNLSISTNNEPDQNGNPTKPKGSVSVVTTDGEVIGLKETDKKQSIRFNAYKPLTLSVRPLVKQEGSDYDGPDYELDYIRVTDSTGRKTIYRASDLSPDGSLAIGEFDKDIDVLVQFREVSGDEKASVIVNKYYLDGENNVYPLADACSVTASGVNDASDKPLRRGSLQGSSFALTTGSGMELEAVPATSLTFSLEEEPGFRIADNPIRAEYSANGSEPQAVTVTDSGSVFYISPDYVPDKAVLSVDVYYLPTYSVLYHGNGNDSGSEPTDSYAYENGDVLGSAAHPLQGAGSLKRRGFTFDGWSTESGDGNGSAKVTEITFSGRDVDLYAIWEPQNPLRVTYDGNGNTSGTAPVDSETYYSGEIATVLGRNGMAKTSGGVTYVFAGWHTDPSAQTALYREYDATQQNADGKFAVTENTTLYAVWLPQYRVTYHDGIDTPPTDNTTYGSGDEVTVLGSAGTEKTVGGVNYRFDGWDISSAASTAVYVPGDSARGTFNITANTDLYAVWTARYTVTYHGNGNTGGAAPVDDDSPYDSGSTVTMKDEGTLVKKGHTFSGWSLTADGAAVYGSDNQTFVIGSDVDLYAVWTIQTPKVSYSLDVPDDVNFTAPSDKNYEYGKTVSVEAKPEAPAYDPLKYTFHGWNTDSDDLAMNAAGTSFTMPDHDVAFTGYFTVNGMVNLTYNANGGSPADKVPAPVSQYTRIGTTVADMPEECVKTGFTFDHWNTQSDDQGDSYAAGDPITVEGGDVVLYAQWRKNSYTVQYYGLKNGQTGEQLLKESGYLYGDAVSVGGVNLDEIPGKAFSRWTLANASQKDAEGQAIGDRLSFPMPAGAVVYHAVYDDLIYSVEYSYTGTVPTGAPAVPTDSGSYAFGGSVTVADAPTLAGYSLDGWKLGGEKTSGFTIGAETPVTVTGTLTRKIALTGTWVRNGDVNITYTSGFTSDNAPHDSLKVVREDTCTKGLDYTLKHNSGFTNYSYPGYTFSGWKIVAETASPNTGGFFARMMSVFARRTFAVGNVYNEGDTITALNKNITVEAVWTQNPSQETYRVTYDGNGSTGGEAPTDSTAYAEGATPEVLGQNTLTRTGSSFKGWNTAANGGGTHYSAGDRLPGMTANVTLYAMWSESGEPGNPGTGESALLSALASAALLISSGAALAVIFRRRKRKA